MKRTWDRTNGKLHGIFIEKCRFEEIEFLPKYGLVPENDMSVKCTESILIPPAFFRFSIGLKGPRVETSGVLLQSGLTNRAKAPPDVAPRSYSVVDLSIIPRA